MKMAGLLALSLAGAGAAVWEYHFRLPDAAQIENWGILAGVQDAEAIQSLQMAASRGSVVAARTIGKLLVLKADEASVKEGQQWLLKASNDGDARAQLALGKLLLMGAPGITSQPLAALPWFESALKGGQAGAAHYLGLIYRQDLPNQARSPEKALHYFEVAAKAGIADSQFLLGQMIMLGDGTPADPESARKWFEAAAEQDQPEANLQLLMAYSRNELGLQRDADSEARQWMEARHSLMHRPPAP